MASDGSYDRQFITGVLSTGIYCLPSCRARKPKPENVEFFPTINAARGAGLRACKKCRPDDYYAGTDVELDRLEDAVAKLRANPSDFASIGDFGTQAEMGTSKLFESVRHHYHVTPGELIVRTRVENACARLLNSEASVSDIAFAVGFETLSTFYENFGRLVGMAPVAYRKLGNAQAFSVTLPESFRRSAVLGYFGRDPLSLSEKVEGTELWISTQFGQGPGSVHLRFDDTLVECHVEGGTPVEAHRGVCRMIGLRQDPKAFEQLAAKLGHDFLYEGRSGLRVPLTFSEFDAVVWSILGQQVNLTFAYSLRRKLVELLGVPVGNGLISPPTPESIGQLSVEDLLPLQFSRRKAEYLIDLSRLIAARTLDLCAIGNGAATRAEKTMLEIRGLGPWSVHYLMMRGFGFADCLPVGDTGITSALQKCFQLEIRPDVAVTRQLMEPFSPQRSLACLHLWQTLKFES